MPVPAEPLYRPAPNDIVLDPGNGVSDLFGRHCCYLVGGILGSLYHCFHRMASWNIVGSEGSSDWRLGGNMMWQYAMGAKGLARTTFTGRTAAAHPVSRAQLQEAVRVRWHV